MKRSKSRIKGDIYQLFVERRMRAGGPLFVLAARRRKKATTPIFLIAAGGPAQDFVRDLKTSSSSNIIAVVRGNRQGTVYRCCSQGSAADAGSTGSRTSGGQSQERSSFTNSLEGSEDGRESIAVQFRQDGVTSVGGIRQFSAVLPDPGAPAVLHNNARTGLIERRDAVRDPGREGLCTLRSVKPAYDDKVKGFVLDFKGRVQLGSPKNCQLTVDTPGATPGQDVLFMFGKRSNDEYVMDFAYPLSMLQAFTIAIACFDTRSFSSA